MGKDYDAKHRTPDGEKSTSEKAWGRNDVAHDPKHAATETTGSDLPHRDGRPAEH